MADDGGDDDMDDDMMDKISSSPSIDDEDIDFEFVYALHTFVATVEGQANATKGDTMVLLDDSNSYWWLVRVVKDGSIGYLPAEHIETPTERLARLNKHRNIDLSATMLGDTAEKSKNPLKKAMRRRNAKTVVFVAPTYYEPSDYDYSSDEDEENDELWGGPQPQEQEAHSNQEAEQDEITSAEPQKAATIKDSKADANILNDTENKPKDENGEMGVRTSNEMFDREYNNHGKSRMGTVRNTDSFFKDDTVETRKITLTPNILRDDSSGSIPRSSDSKERSASFDSLEKASVAPEKEDKKRKEKKSGMLSGLFKRKEKKAKSGAADGPSSEKQSEEYARESPTKFSSEENSPIERVSTSTSDTLGERTDKPQRHPSKGKLQKAHPESILKSRSTVQPTDGPRTDSPAQVTTGPSAPNGAPASSAGTLSPEVHPKPVPISQYRRSADAQQQKGKPRMVLDVSDSDGSPDNQTTTNPFTNPSYQEQQGPTSQSEEDRAERLSESPVEISPVDNDRAPDARRPPALMIDTSSQEEPEISPVSPASTSSLLEISAPQSTDLASSSSSGTVTGPQSTAPSQQQKESYTFPPAPNRSPPQPQQAPIAPVQHPAPSPSPPPSVSVSSTSNSRKEWSDSSLRHYLDDGSEIRDMLLLIRDTSDFVPVGPNDPLATAMFGDERARVDAMQKDLDAMMSGLMGRKRLKKKTSATQHSIPVRGRS
ncbi:hypothetical protein M501DRAFT_1005063 [Patellaria atrata CBS 101060]|uniref:SH3 domain-containing protein n=1 Tax=Patellaria atrata CBS 101060 TaxID=1346257 RepID=A0A9P4S987_9PEZI|nr:hypothetical protein M501DRAFT_1005063 [Patellaria atrata CBS 101060]